MTTVVLLLLAGIIMIAAEVFLPGGILGVLGGVAMLGGIGAAYSEFGGPGALYSSAVALVMVGLALYFEFGVLPKTRLGKRLFLKNSIKDTVMYSSASDDLIGQEGETITALGPTGFVKVSGIKVEAASRSGFIEKNQRVKVVGRDNFRIIVSKI